MAAVQESETFKVLASTLDLGYTFDPNGQRKSLPIAQDKEGNWFTFEYYGSSLVFQNRAMRGETKLDKSNGLLSLKAGKEEVRMAFDEFRKLQGIMLSGIEFELGFAPTIEWAGLDGMYNLGYKHNDIGYWKRWIRLPESDSPYRLYRASDNQALV